MKKIQELLPLKEVADIKFCIVSNSKESQKTVKLRWLTVSNLLADNIVNEITESEKYFKDDSLLIRTGDIIIKRIQPSFVNYIDTNMPDTYAYNNLIVVRAKGIDAKYLAAVLNYEIKEISLNSSKGAVMPSIGRNELDHFAIPILPARKQKRIGEIWHKSIEKKKMAIRLAELENIKENYLINEYIKNQIGGKNDDNI
jgi:hypothetical protein